mgnify:CR=1 FL=1
MENKLLDGKLVSEKLYNELKEKVSKLSIKPKLAVILVGDNPASKSYVKSKQKALLKVGMEDETITLSADITEEELIAKINELNNDNSVHGILVQLPLPKHLNETKILNTINPEKDVDGFTTINAGLLFSGQEPYSIPCTPAGICKLLDEYNIETSGKNVVVLGRSNIVGKPIAFLLSQKPYNATVTICHSATKNLTDILERADIIIAAMGKPEFITASSIKKGAIIIDVGINRVEDKTKEKGYRLCGDVNFQDCYDKCSFITPVPGGVGLMTVACLIENTYKACLKTNQV